MAADTTPTIDKLQVEIEATARGTASTFKQLEDNLKSLQKALNAIDFGKIKAMQKVVNATTVKPNTSGMSKAESEVKASVEKIQRALAGLEAYANKSLGGDKSAFKSFERSSTSAQSQIDMLKKKLEQIGNVAAPTKAFEKVNRDIEETKAHLDSLKAKEQEATDSGGRINLSREDWIALANEIVDTEAKLEQFNAEADRLVREGKDFYDPFKTYRDSIENAQGQLTNMQEQVNEAFANLGNVQPDTTGLDSFMSKLVNDIPAGISKIQQDFAGLGAYTDAALNGDKSAFTSFERRVTSIQSAIDIIVNKMAQLEGSGVSVNGLENYKNVLQSIQAQLSETISAVRTAYEEMSKAPQPKVVKETEKATTSMKGLASTRTGIDGLSKALGKIADRLKGISIQGPNLKKAFMTILKYGFGVRSLYVLFRRLRKAVIESFGELQKSGAFYQTTKANVEALKTSLLTLKYQFGAAFEPIFNAVAPAIKVFIDNLVTAMNALSAFMARLTGKSTYSKVMWVNTATEQAAKNAKELNKQLQKFDELNNLTTNKGGNGSGSDDALKAVYTTENVENALGEFGQKLADLMRAGDWNGVGTVISEKLAEQLNSINWTNIKGKAAKFGHNLADFLNGLINPETFKAIGTTVGEAINTGLTFFNEWGKGMKWENLGKSLAEGFNAWLKAGNLPLLGETLHTWLSGGLDALITFLDEADFEELGKQLAEFISKLNIPDLAKKLGKLAIKILEALGEAIKGLWNNSDITGKITMALVGLLLTLNFAGKLGGLAALIIGALGGSFGSGGLTGALGSMFGTSLAGQTITVAANGLKLKLLGAGLVLSGAGLIGSTALASSVENNPFAFDKETGVKDWSKLLLGTGGGALSIASGAGFISKLAGGTFSAAFAKALPAAAGILGAQWGGSYAGNQIGKSWWQMMGRDDISSAYDEWLGFGIDPIKTFKGYADIFEGIKTGNFGDAWNNMWGDVGEWFYDTHQENRRKLKEWGEELINDYFGGDANAIVNKVSETSTGIGKAWEGVADKVNKTTNAYKGLGSVTADVGNKTKELISHTTKFGTESTNSSNKFKTAIGDLPSKVQNIFTKAYADGTNTWSGLGNWATQKVTEVSNGVSGLTSKTSETFGNAYSQSTSKWNGIKEWASGVFANVDSQANEKLSKVPMHFNKSFQDSATNARTHLSSFNTWFQSLNFEKKAGVQADEPSFNKVKTTYESFIKNIKNHTATINVEGKGFSEIGNQIDNIVSKLRNAQSLKSGLSNSYSSYSSYSNLRYFASGGIVSGAMQAVVGEAGPEAILPLTDGTLGSLAHLIVGEMATPQMTSVNSNISGYYGGSDAVAEQNQLLREEVQLLRQIAGKEFTVSSSDVFNATRQESNNYYNRTGNSPFLF